MVPTYVSWSFQSAPFRDQMLLLLQTVLPILVHRGRPSVVNLTTCVVGEDVWHGLRVEAEVCLLGSTIATAHTCVDVVELRTVVGDLH